MREGVLPDHQTPNTKPPNGENGMILTLDDCLDSQRAAEILELAISVYQEGAVVGHR
jgi:hypothetical protein